MVDDLKNKHCRHFDADEQPLTSEQCHAFLLPLPGWELSEDQKIITKSYKLKNFDETMALVERIAQIAKDEDHHPDVTFGYNYCRIVFSTHSIGGLSENDFICAAKIDG